MNTPVNRFKAEMSWRDADGLLYADQRNDLSGNHDGKRWLDNRFRSVVGANGSEVVGDVWATLVAPDSEGVVRPLDRPVSTHHVESDDWAEASAAAGFVKGRKSPHGPDVGNPADNR